MEARVGMDIWGQHTFFFFSPVKIVFLLCGELSVVSIQFW